MHINWAINNCIRTKANTPTVLSSNKDSLSCFVIFKETVNCKKSPFWLDFTKRTYHSLSKMVSLSAQVKHGVAFLINICASTKHYSSTSNMQKNIPLLNTKQYTWEKSSVSSSWKTCKLSIFSIYPNHRDLIQRKKASYKTFRAKIFFQFRYLPHHLPVNLFVLIFWSSIWPLLQGYLSQKSKSHHLVNQATLHSSPLLLKITHKKKPHVIFKKKDSDRK